MQPKVRVAIQADYDGRWAAQVVGDAKRVATSVTSTGRQVSQSMQSANLNTAGLAAQFNDIGVMLASGQNPLLLALQQGTQVAQTLGPMGAAGAAKALGAAFLSVISPLNLITIGTIALGAAAVQWLMGLNKEAPSTEEALKRHSEWLQKILEGYEGAAAAASKAAEESRKLPQTAVVSDLGAQLTADTRSYTAALEALKNTRDAYLEDKTKIFWEAPDAIAQADALAQVQDQLDLANPRLDELISNLTEIKNSAVNDKIRSIAESLIVAAQAAQTTANKIAQTRAALDQLRFPPLPKSYLDAMSGLGDMAKPAQTDREKALATYNAGLGGAQDSIQRAALKQQYDEALARIAAAEEAQKAAGTNRGSLTNAASGIKELDDGLVALEGHASGLADTITSSLATAATGFFTTLRNGGDAISYLTGQLGNLADQLLNSALQNIFGGITGSIFGVGGIGGLKSMPGIGGLTGTVSYRAAGGPVVAGKPYIVGERQPELFVPGTNGEILPAIPTDRAAAPRVVVNVRNEAPAARVEEPAVSFGRGGEVIVEMAVRRVEENMSRGRYRSLGVEPPTRRS